MMISVEWIFEVSWNQDVERTSKMDINLCPIYLYLYKIVNILLLNNENPGVTKHNHVGTLNL